MADMDISKPEDSITTTQCKAVYLNNVPTKKKWFQHCFNWGSFIDVIIFIMPGETFSSGQLLLVTLVAPLLIMMIVESMRRKNGASWLKIWIWYVGNCICHLTFFTFTTPLKLVASELRPHFLQTCAPDAARNCTTGEYITEYQCLSNGGKYAHNIVDAYMSFPSGHASIATILSIFCTVYILKRFNSINAGYFLKPVLISFLMAFGFMVSISRVVDRRHHWWDVMAGIVTGIIISVICIKFHCDSFEITEKGICDINNTCPRLICKESKAILKDISF